jgi:hypothetical protein
MPALPDNSDLTGGTRTRAQVRDSLGQQRDYLAGLLGTDGTIATANGSLGTALSRYETRSAASSVVPADRGKVLACTGTWTLTLPPADTAGAGFAVAVQSLSGSITVATSGSETVDGEASASMPSGGAFASRLFVSTGTAWSSLLLPRPDGLMQSATDATAMRLLRIFGTAGVFGLGASGGAPTLANLDDHTMPSQMFRTTAGDTTGTWPPGQSAIAGVGVMLRNANTVAVQLWARTSASNGLWMRRYHGAWSAWERPTPVLGTVSQSDGVPTGAIFETGQGANGFYHRAASGLLQCRHTLTTATAGGTTWTFPSAFAAGVVPVLSITPVANGVAIPMLDASPGTTSATVSVRDASGARIAVPVHLTATGRWFA